MARKELTDKEIVATIFHKLARKGCWGGKYKPYDSVVSWIEGRIKHDGQRVKEIINGLVQDGYLLTKKSGNVISLNTKKKVEIQDAIDRILK